MSHFTDTLNPAQKEAVLNYDKPSLIVAGAGSGKTRVLTSRIAYMIEQGVHPGSILALTFTNKAAREMRERIKQLVPDGRARYIWMGTFHSVFYRILRQEAGRLGFDANFTIYDTANSESLLSTIIKERNLNTDEYKPRDIHSRISLAKNNLVTAEAYAANTSFVAEDRQRKRPEFSAIFLEYARRCKANNAMDFDDLLIYANILFRDFPDALEQYRNRFRYILVDEYQDTNYAQYLIVRRLAQTHSNVCVVGDDAQSIYSFRGANIANILHFNRDYPEARIFKLEQNYRSTKNIVGAANSVIAKNRDKLDKDVWTANDAGEPVRVVRNLTDGDEAYYIARTIKSLREDDPKARYQDFAVLYRTNAQSRAIEDALRRHNIPYRIWGGQSFYARKEIKDALAYMRLAVNPKDEEALLRVINYPARGIGETTLNKLIVAANHYGRSVFEVIGALDRLPQLAIQSGVRAKLDAFATMIQAFGVYASTLDAFEAADKILRESGILSLMSSATDPEDVARYENVQELVNSIKDFVESQKEIADEDASLSTFVQQVALLTDMDRGEESDTDRVALMTVHMAKGLEFGTVFVAGMEENLFPSMMSSSTREEIEEERRLFYVALTRAERRAILTYAEQRYRWGKLTDGELSRFVDEIDDRYLEFSVPKEMRRAAGSSILDAGIFGAASGPSAPAPFRRRTERPSGSASGRSAAPKNLKPLGKAVAAAAGAGASGGQGNLAVGDRVRHERFGDGTVLTLEGAGADAKATICFDNIGEKKMLLKFAKIQKI